MGTNRTTSGGQYAAILVPHPFTEADNTTAIGTDYSITDPYAGAPTASGTSTLALEAAGDLASASTSIAVRVIRSGMASGVVGKVGGVVYSVDGGPTYARDDDGLVTGYHGLTSNNVTHPHAIVTDDGTLWVAYQVGSTSRVITVGIGAAGSDVVVYNDSDACCICVAADGTLRCYVAGADGRLRVYRGTVDGGNAWTLVHSSAAIVGTVTRMRAERDTAGAIGLWVVNGSGGTCTTNQFGSSDGGFQFSSVAETTGYKVWDARLLGGIIYLVVGEDPSALTAGHYLRKTASAFTDPLIGDGAGTEITTTTNLTARNNGVACIAASPTGRMYVLIDHSSGTLGYRSDDSGATWTTGSVIDPAPDLTPGASTPYGHHTATWHRGCLLVVTNDAGNGGTANQAHVHTFGGHTSVPVTGEFRTGGWTHHADPSDTLANHNYAVNDVVPAGGRTLSFDAGQYVTAAAGGAARNDADTGASTESALAIAALRPDTGATLTVRLGGDDAAVKVDVTQTQIRAYDPTGAASSYANHGVNCAGGEYVEVMIVLDGTANKGAVWYRERGPYLQTERAWTSLAALTSLGSSGDTTYVHRLETAANGSGWWLWAGVATRSSFTSTLATGTVNDTIREACAIPLLSTLTWLTGDVYLRRVSGVPVVDGVTHAIAATSRYPLRNAFPTRSPSPSRVWKSPLDGGDALSFSPSPALVAPVLGVYLDGLSAITDVDVVVNGAVTRSASLGLSFSYDGGSGVIRGTTTAGTATSVGWVRKDELVGWGFLSDDGSFATVTGNTEGALVWGTTTTRRAAIQVTNDGATNGSGTLLPPRVLLLAQFTGANQTAGTLRIETTSVAAAESTTHSIGVLAIGPVEVLPVPDLNTSVVLDDEANVSTYSDGSRRSWRRHRDRRRVQLGWVQSHHDHLNAAETSPDYIALSTGGDPSATWDAIAMQAQGIVEAADGEPVVVCLTAANTFNVPSNCTVIRPIGTGVDLVYGRIVGGWRREALPNVGSHGAQAWRIPPIVVEEEL